MIWAIFMLAVVIMLALDLGVFNKQPHVISQKEAAIWSAVWVTVALSFGGILYWLFLNDHIENPLNYSPGTALSKYITAYLVELSLSVDNIFVIAVIFTSFKIPQKYQHEVLFWGIVGAVIFRALMIFFGVWLINKVDWITYVFGAFLVYTAFTMVKPGKEEEMDPTNNRFFKMIRKILPVTKKIHGPEFIIRKMGKWAITPLLLALIVIEFTDILFALDSIPAVLAITEDPFIVFSSNILAVLGLRSMYFFLANIIDKFSYLKYSLGVILLFVGVKMLLHDYMKTNEIEIPEFISLLVIFLALLGGVLYSLYKNKQIDRLNS